MRTQDECPATVTWDDRPGTVPASRRMPPVTCAHASCGEPTSDRKPYCTEHVEMNPHAAALAAELARRDREVERLAASARGRIPSGSTVLGDVAVVLVERGQVTPRRREIQLEVPRAAAVAYLRRLARDGRARLCRSPRGLLVAVDPSLPDGDLAPWARPPAKRSRSNRQGAV